MKTHKTTSTNFPQILFLADNLGEPNGAGRNWCHAVWKQPRRNVQRKHQAASCWVCMYSLVLVMLSNTERVGTNAGAVQTVSGPVSDHHMDAHRCALLHSCSRFNTLHWQKTLPNVDAWNLFYGLSQASTEGCSAWSPQHFKGSWSCLDWRHFDWVWCTAGSTWDFDPHETQPTLYRHREKSSFCCLCPVGHTLPPYVYYIYLFVFTVKKQDVLFLNCLK